jgi:hypothetical protein
MYVCMYVCMYVLVLVGWLPFTVFMSKFVGRVTCYMLHGTAAPLLIWTTIVEALRIVALLFSWTSCWQFDAKLVANISEYAWGGHVVLSFYFRAFEIYNVNGFGAQLVHNAPCDACAAQHTQHPDEQLASIIQMNRPGFVDPDGQPSFPPSKQAPSRCGYPLKLIP